MTTDQNENPNLNDTIELTEETSSDEELEAQFPALRLAREHDQAMHSDESVSTDSPEEESLEEAAAKNPALEWLVRPVEPRIAIKPPSDVPMEMGTDEPFEETDNVVPPAEPEVESRPGPKKRGGRPKGSKNKPKATDKAAEKPAKSGPTTGQSAPPKDLPFERLNTNERKIVSTLLIEDNALTIETLALRCFPDLVPAKANSWTRNALRRLVPCNWARKVDRGSYALSEAARTLLVQAQVDFSTTAVNG